ncbi:UNVERIFIED_CONTAM: hypothetical protein FKN15_050179 [Acipenser sinensis]
MVQWFEKARDIWVEGGQLKSEALLNLTEDFFDALMVGKKQVIGSFLHRTGELIADSSVHITIQQELLMPADDKLQDFWIDFNVGSQSITFYISPDDDEEETQWETVCLPEDEVEKYLVEEKDGNNLLKVSMKHPLNVSGKEGSQIQIYFSAALNIAEAIKNVYGAIKAKVSFTALSFWGR